MAGAMPLSGLGSGFLISKKDKDVQVRELLGQYYVLVRRTDTWAEIIAICSQEEHARLLVTVESSKVRRAILRGLRSPQTSARRKKS